MLLWLFSHDADLHSQEEKIFIADKMDGEVSQGASKGKSEEKQKLEKKQQQTNICAAWSGPLLSIYMIRALFLHCAHFIAAIQLCS